MFVCLDTSPDSEILSPLADGGGEAGCVGEATQFTLSTFKAMTPGGLLGSTVYGTGHGWETAEGVAASL